MKPNRGSRWPFKMLSIHLVEPQPQQQDQPCNRKTYRINVMVQQRLSRFKKPLTAIRSAYTGTGSANNLAKRSPLPVQQRSPQLSRLTLVTISLSTTTKHK